MAHLEQDTTPPVEPASPTDEEVLAALKRRLQWLSLDDMQPLQELIEYKLANPDQRASYAPDYHHFQASVMLAELIDAAYGDVTHDSPLTGRRRHTMF